jgi:nucleoid-associated protein YgaU
MSVMSAAGASQTGATGPGVPVPRRRLRVARPSAGGDRGDGPGGVPEAEGAEQWGQGTQGDRPWPAEEVRSTELHVSEVRVVRQASVRTVRSAGSRSAGSGPAPASAGPAMDQVGVAAARRTATAQARTAAFARAAAAGQAVTRTRVASQSRTVAQTRVVARTRAAERTGRPGAVRLTRRGRRVVAALAMLLVIAAAMLLWITAAGSVQASSRGTRGATASPYQGMTQVVVRPGQTLWSIAAAAEPSANSWAVVQQIVQVNALNSATIRAGQLLWVPKSSATW